MLYQAKILFVFTIMAIVSGTGCGSHKKKNNAGSPPAPAPAPAPLLDTVLVGQQPGDGKTTITYKSNTSGTSFQCRLIKEGQDAASVPWETCPEGGKTVSTAGLGRATFEVRAVKDGLPDATPLQVAITDSAPTQTPASSTGRAELKGLVIDNKSVITRDGLDHMKARLTFHAVGTNLRPGQVSYSCRIDKSGAFHPCMNSVGDGVYNMVELGFGEFTAEIKATFSGHEVKDQVTFETF